MQKFWNRLTFMVADITPEHDVKLQELLKLLVEKIEHLVITRIRKY